MNPNRSSIHRRATQALAIVAIIFGSVGFTRSAGAGTATEADEMA